MGITKKFSIFNFQFSKGFSLIELVVVIGVIAVSLPIIFGLVFINLQTQSRIYILQEVKRNGDNALDTMESLIRQYASSLYKDSSLNTVVCTTSGESYSSPFTPPLGLYFKDKFGSWFRFYLDSDTNKIASQSSVAVTSYLTNNKVAISNFTIGCNRPSGFSPPLISVSFTVSQLASAARHEEKATLNYQTKVKLRSY